jgi:hypothetical protein
MEAETRITTFGLILPMTPQPVEACLLAQQ